MENKLRNHNPSTCIPNSHTPNSLAMIKESHKISKTKPKIRIIHIFAPEIIKTDAENFRELVQKLTGKPPTGEKKYGCKKKSRVVGESAEGREQESRSSSSGGSEISSEDCSRMITTKKNGEFFGLDMIRERVIKEEIGGGISSTDESIACGGYMGGFSDLEGFIAEIGGGFPLLPMDGTHLQGFEQPQLL